MTALREQTRHGHRESSETLRSRGSCRQMSYPKVCFHTYGEPGEWYNCSIIVIVIVGNKTTIILLIIVISAVRIMMNGIVIVVLFLLFLVDTYAIYICVCVYIHYS